MTAPGPADQGPPLVLELRRALRRRLAPLLLLLVAVVTLATPVTAFVLSVHELRGRGAALAGQLAEELGHEARRRPALWQYDSIKVLAHLRAYAAQPDVARIVVLDRDGRTVDRRRGAARAGAGEAPARVVWERAPLGGPARELGTVWVGMGYGPALASALWLLPPALALGLALAGLLFWVSDRYVGRAEAEVRRLVDRLALSHRILARSNADLEAEVEARVAELRTVTARAVALQEAERRAIGRDLHDGVGQALTGLRIHLKLIADRLAAGGDAEGLARAAAGIADAALDEVRRAAERLGPHVVEEVGLAGALERLCADVAERAGLAVALETEGLEGGLAEAVEVATYRIAQEALTNAVRHAEAASVEVAVRAAGGELVLEVRDDGVGAGARAAAGGGGRGVAGMRERAQLLGGRLELGAGPGGRGTAVRATVPLRGAAAAEAEA